MVRTKEDIFPLIQSNASSIKALGAERIGLFGSFARGEQKETSDIDLVVEFRPGMKTFDNLFDMMDLLEALFQKKVDLLTWEGMAGFVQTEVKKDIEYVSFVD
ncbi:nucleotidyltransferase family protein [Dyadobacter sp. OTU695]|uniref:nucleotidyltransferase family protein n=1 Tax=Dyadobacter sp. OTU695 TaxID=3043860 RepID=UPI00313B4198